MNIKTITYYRLSNKILNLHDIIKELVTLLFWEREKLDEMTYEV